jgi:hypothetical protein
MSVLCKKVFDPNPQPWGTKDAKEVAKKLIKTGAIRAIKSSIEKEKIKEEKINSGFKRSQVSLIGWHGCLQCCGSGFGPPASESGSSSKRYGPGSGSFSNQAKILLKTIPLTVL